MKLVTIYMFTELFLAILFQQSKCTENKSYMNSKNNKFLTSNLVKNSMKSLFSFQNYKILSENEKYQGYPIVSLNEDNLGEGPVYYQGWSKYFISLGKTKSNIKKFLINEQYLKEQTINWTGEKGYIVPDLTHFYFILTDEYLNVLDSRIVN